PYISSMGVLPWSCRCGLNPTPSKNRGAPARPPPPHPAARVRRSKYTGQSVRAMPMRVLTVGKKRSQGTQLLVEEYKEKLGHYCDVEDTLIKSNPKLTSDVKVQIEAEDASMMQQLKAEDFVVVLDENGKDVMSEQIADLIGDAGNTVCSALWLIGYSVANYLVLKFKLLEISWENYFLFQKKSWENVLADNTFAQMF
uniref:Uncharacterized protein n=1 Tax=Aegilops tauschii subsp. strangulata TaxID=200361 RepID=A0A453CT36_AEGTS